MIDVSRLLEVAKKAALQAGEAIMEVYTSGNFGVELKGDNLPLTLADKAAHAIIVSHLQSTGFPVLSEEGSTIPFEERKNWNYFWMVDPLDGTKEFIKRSGEFTVNIALIHNSIPVAGVIYAPVPEILYYGSSETGVYKTEKGKQIRLTFLPQKIAFEELHKKEQVTVVASVSHLNNETVTFINQFKNTRSTSMGSSFKLMLVAEGAADIYPRLAPTMEWDTAAGDALLRSLNKGTYTTDLVTPLTYNKETLLNPSFVAY